MNLYFLVEGETERKVYPQWLSHLLPGLSRVYVASEARQNNYYLISGGGYPSILDNHLKNAIEEVNECGLYDTLVLAIDADEMTTQDKMNEVNQFLTTAKISLNTQCSLQIIVQKYCVETWLMGNRKAYTRNPGKHSDFYRYTRFYDVSRLDPELMEKPQNFTASTSKYHHAYLKKMLAEKNIGYNKASPDGIGTNTYLEQLKKRIEDTHHLPSLDCFFTFCASIGV